MDKDAERGDNKKQSKLLPSKAGTGRLAIGSEFLVMKSYYVKKYSGITIHKKLEDQPRANFYYDIN